MNIEQEINRRVNFKMKEFKTSFINHLEWAKHKDKVSLGHLHYRGKFEAYTEIEKSLEKEINLPTIYDGDYEKMLRTRKNKMIDELSGRLLKIGTREYDSNIRAITNIVEKYLEYNT
tara:strand:+ start:22602 stop:22952 length:351 start_codon:yes stop_codon:yes gene_type:complete